MILKVLIYNILLRRCYYFIIQIRVIFTYIIKSRLIFTISIKQKQISSKRWRKVEPFDDYYSPERPVLIKQAIELLVDKKIYTKQLLLDTFGLDTHFIEQACSVDPDYFTQSKILYMKIL